MISTMKQLTRSKPMKNKLTFMFILFFVMMLGVSLAQKSIKGIQGNTGKRWAICIGISDYKDNRIADLTNARTDAKVLADVLKKEGQFDEVLLFTDDIDPNNEFHPTKANIQKKLGDLKGLIKPDDLVLFFFSGHGISNAAGEGFLVLANSYRENLNGTSLRVKDVTGWLNETGVKKSLLLLDASREKFLMTGASLKGVSMEDFAPAAVGAAFYGTRAGGIGYDNTGASVGAFAGNVIDGLKGHADSRESGGNGDGLVTFSELASYITKGVSKWASSSGKNQQVETRIFDNSYGNLALSTYAAVPALVFKPAAGASSAVSVVQLRKDYLTLKDEEVNALLQKFGFFDSKRNTNRSFKNAFEVKTIGGDKVIMDNASGLMWHAGGSDKGMELDVCKGWLSSLNARGYAGFKDWRLPTLEEAASLLESSKKNGNLYIDPVFSVEQKTMWTGDTFSSEAGWLVSFERGQVQRDYNFNYFFIRPVRSVK